MKYEIVCLAAPSERLVPRKGRYISLSLARSKKNGPSLDLMASRVTREKWRSVYRPLARPTLCSNPLPRTLPPGEPGPARTTLTEMESDLGGKTTA